MSPTLTLSASSHSVGPSYTSTLTVSSAAATQPTGGGVGQEEEEAAPSSSEDENEDDDAVHHIGEIGAEPYALFRVQKL